MSDPRQIEAFVWSEQLAVGIEEIDQQHQILIALINQLATAETVGASRADLQPVINELVRYAGYHFDTEESLMARYAVTEAHLERHKREHADFRQKVAVALPETLTAADLTEKLRSLLNFLVHWLLGHILGTDKLLADEIRARQQGESLPEHDERSLALRKSDGILLQAIHALSAKVRERAEEVAAKNRELQELNEQLEARVVERTKALEQVVESLRATNESLAAANQELHTTQNQLVLAEKMASIGQLAAGVAHEINNPVGFVRSNLGTLGRYFQDLMQIIEAYRRAEIRLGETVCPEVAGLRTQLDLDYLLEDIPKLLSESQEGIDRVREIVLDLRDFSRSGSEDWQLADLERGLDATLNVAANELKYKARVVKHYAKLPLVECLPAEMNQVFLNLLVNAAQAISERGTITVSTCQKDAEVCVEIADTGCGIPPEHIPKLFDPFFTTKPVGMGTGLGLSVSYGIVHKHHGRIEVESEVGKGTRFQIWLPLRQSAATQSPPH